MNTITKPKNLGEAIALVDRDKIMNNLRSAGNQGATFQNLRNWVADELRKVRYHSEIGAGIATRKLLEELSGQIRTWKIGNGPYAPQTRYAVK